MFKTKQLIAGSVACLLCVGCLQAQEPVSSSSSKLSQPSETELEEGIATLKAVYASGYRRTEDKNTLQAKFAGLALAPDRSSTIAHPCEVVNKKSIAPQM